MLPMDKIIKKINYKTFLTIFFGFFIYEYGSPLVSFIYMAKEWEIPLVTLLMKQQVLKHFIRFPVYLFTYIYLFKTFLKNKTSYGLLKFMLISHMIFKPLTVILALKMMEKNNIELITANKAYIWAGVIFGLYLFFLKYITERYKIENKKEEK